MTSERFEEMLTGGHPNSLGRTVEVVNAVLTEPSRLAELYGCYFSADEVVRLRTSSALKRAAAQHPAWLVPYIDGLLGEVAQIDQASANWTLAQLMAMLEEWLTVDQKARATDVMKRKLETSSDWIVLIQTMQTLATWAREDADLRFWLEPELRRLRRDERKSVAGRATKLLASLGGYGVSTVAR